MVDKLCTFYHKVLSTLGSETSDNERMGSYIARTSLLDPDHQDLDENQPVWEPITARLKGR